MIHKIQLSLWKWDDIKWFSKGDGIAELDKAEISKTKMIVK